MRPFVLAAALACTACVQGAGPAARGYAPLAAPPFAAADEQEYQKRRARYLTEVASTMRLAAYDPVEAVPGARQPTPLPRSEDSPIPAATLARAADYAAGRNSSALLVAVGGRLALERYGQGFDAQTPLVSKAMAKQVATLAVGRAITLGKLGSLDQSVAEFITEWAGDPRRSRITIRHLIENRSGLLPQDFSPDAPEVLLRAYLHPRHDAVLVHEYPMTHEPGSRFEYSNANSELIAIIVERATGRRYAEFVGRELLAPIGAAGGSVWVNRRGGLAHSGCCMMLPAQSWLRLGMLVLADGRWDGREIVSPAFVRQMKTPTAQNPHFGTGLYVAGPYVERRGFLNPANTLGAVLHSEPYLDRDITLFDGNGNQVMYLIPSLDMVVLRMGERPPQAREWDNSFLPNLLIRGGLEASGAPPPQPQKR